LRITLQQTPTLGAALLQRNLPVPKDAADIEQPITSYSVLDDERGFVIAYYGVEPDAMLRELRVRAYDRRSGTWRSARFPEPIGSVLSVERNQDFLFVTGHASPSAAPLLVLSDSLDLKRRLDGWPVLMLDDGRVVFTRSMVHFAPAHAAVLALYDPARDREETLYPAGVANERGIELAPGATRMIDRSFPTVRRGESPGTIDVAVVSQQIRVNRQNGGDPVGPAERFRVTCDVTVSPPVCRRIE
jgi:hypothetical protein